MRFLYDFGKKLRNPGLQLQKKIHFAEKLSRKLALCREVPCETLVINVMEFLSISVYEKIAVLIYIMIIIKLISFLNIQLIPYSFPRKRLTTGSN